MKPITIWVGVDTATMLKELFLNQEKLSITGEEYYHQMLAYNKELTPLIEDIEKVNPNQKPFREGSKFIPLKKRK